ncbi:GPI mannosyltransferase 2 [Pseudozyma hubeiensis]|nr:GPI mannosyltransferase 2 [Pseudozyma hubeiensis]
MAQRRPTSSRPFHIEAPSVQHQPTRKNDDDQRISITAKKLAAAQSRLLKLSLVVRLASITLLVIISHLQQAFDTSHELLSFSLDPLTSHGLSAGGFKWLLAFVRWDTIYFVAAASPSSSTTVGVHQGGYATEQSLAFQPGIVALLRIAGYVTPSLDGAWSPTAAILVITALANAAAVASPVLLYRLSLKVTRDAELAYTAALLSVFAPSAGTTLTSPTPESFYSVASLLGMLSLETSNAGVGWIQVASASIFFALATSFRANGTLLVGYFSFKLVSEARSSTPISAALKLALSTILSISPNILFQTWAYGRFCLGEEQRPWCQDRLPSIYTFVQSHYWNVGFLRYWEVSQLPNFALAAPVLAAIAYTVSTFYRHSSWGKILYSTIPAPSSILNPAASKATSGLSLSICPTATPYVMHALALGLILTFASHVQIALRLATPGGMPAVWWGAAHLVLYSGARWSRKVVVGYLSVQVCVGIVLYGGFYPPA